MKTKQLKEEQDKSIDEEAPIEPKTRARKKATDSEENKPTQDEPKTSKDKKPQAKPKTLVKKRPLGIRKALRSKKAAVVKEKVKHVIKQAVKRGRKPAIKPDPDACQEKETIPLIPVSEIKKEPFEETAPNSRSSSPKTAGRRSRVSSDMAMMKTVLSDSPSNLVLGPRTSPYAMRSERSNSPSLFEGKNLRSGKPRKVKNNLLNEVVKKEQKKRRRLISDSKNPEVEGEDCKKLKRGRSCSRDGSEVSKCSDNTESDLSMSETLNDSDSRELNKKLDKSKTDLDVDIENNVQISTIEKVPFLNVDSKLAEPKLDAQTGSIVNEKNKKPSLTRSTSLDSDNNNSNRLKLETLNSSDVEDKQSLKTENDTLFQARSNILTIMSETFNSKAMAKNIRRARRGKKAAAEARKPPPKETVKPSPPCTITQDAIEDKHETIETLSKDIDDLIKNLDQNIDRDHELIPAPAATSETKSVSKFYGLKPLTNIEDNHEPIPGTPVKEKEVSALINETTPSKDDDSDSIHLHYEDSTEKGEGPRHEIAYKCNTVASIDKLMDRLKEFEEFDKRRQRQESESKSSDNKPMMVTNDVVLITKSGADIKPLKDLQSVRSPEKPIEKENVLSCFENNSAISIVKRDQARKSLDVDLPNSVTLIKRKSSVSARKESTSSNPSREADAISIFEKSLGKDVTLTEIKKFADKSGTVSQIDLHQLATLHPTCSSQLEGVVLDSSQISITPCVSDASPGGEVQIITKRKSREESLSRKSSESTEADDRMATIEKLKSPSHLSSAALVALVPAAIKSPVTAPVEMKLQVVSPVDIKSPVAAPVEMKSPVATPLETEALTLPVEIAKPVSDEIPVVASEAPVLEPVPNVKPKEKVEAATKIAEPEAERPENIADENPTTEITEIKTELEKMEVAEKSAEKLPEHGLTEIKDEELKEAEPEIERKVEPKPESKPEVTKPSKYPGRPSKSARSSIESQPGPSSLNETPESQKRKENVLRTLGLLTHKAAKEAKIEKLREKERIYSGMANKGKSAKSSGDYTGTLKTVIKLNRTSGDRDKKKHNRSSLKMTFQKSKYRSGKQITDVGEPPAEDDTFYTIERREAGGSGVGSVDEGEAVPEPTEPKEILNLVIPEKASSFSIHPGRLCQDQCFYCGGKFGLFDTPCHIAQIKSTERQKKVLDNEEKLTIDSCLCDACYRHVDRRANCPSYRKRPLPKQEQPPTTIQLHQQGSQADPATIPPPVSEESEEERGALPAGRPAICHTEGCTAPGDHSIRRKWLIKMRSSVNTVLKLKGDYPGLHTIPLCGAHHRALAPLMACVLCRRRLTKHHNLHFIHHGYLELNPLLSAVSLPVQFTSRPVLCKACRYYCTLLQRPHHNDHYETTYRRKLLQIYNIEVPGGMDVENTDASLDEHNKHKKKQRNKSKQRKSTELDSNNSETSEKTNDSTPEKKDKDSESDKQQPIEEDIESLISSNKILVPGAVKTNETTASDGSENEGVFDFEAPVLPVDKRTELQYLLQKQNNPAQFMHGQPNLTQKQKNFLKIQGIPGIQKPGHQHRISEKNAKRIQKLGLMMSKEKLHKKDEMEIFEDKSKDVVPPLKNLTLNDECTIESIPNKRPADINTLKNKWQMSESFTQVKRNLSELSKKLDKEPSKKTSEVKYSNPVKRLETNPSISVRELFPGEEEMNLQCNVEFNNVKGVTPEGWEKCNTMIQYDLETKRLWNELQRPYGNQSSFLRHLILLEKYFRSGDLVLSHNAAPHAANYSDSVQSRLRAYDNVVSDAPRRSEPAISLIEFRKKPSMNGKSLLKSNQNEDKDPKKFMPPPTSMPKTKSKDKSKNKQLPPELIAINTPNAQGRKAIQNVLQNIQQLVKGVSASDPTEIAAAPLPPKFDAPPKFTSAKIETPPKFETPPKIEAAPESELPPPPKEKKDLPKSDTPKKSKSSSKPWRPTLMPITQENLAKIAREPTQVAVDGRALPSLVQVMSSGKRYHITLQDYNKMCIMRREKLQQLHEGEKKRPSVEDNHIVTELQPSTMLGNGGTMTQVNSDEKLDKKEEVSQIGSNAVNILKNVGLKNITIAPIPAKTATITSQTFPVPIVSSPSLLVTSTPIRIPQLSSSVTITSETVLTPNIPMLTTQMIMPKIPKSLTVIPQTVVSNVPQNVVITGASPQVLQSADGPRP